MSEALSKARLLLKAERGEFQKQEVMHLWLVFERDRIKIDPDKVVAVNDWEPTECTFDVWSFVGFANFYRRFIKRFSNIVSPLIAIKSKGITFSWSDECQQAFDKLKKAFTTAPILAHSDWDKTILVETDISHQTFAYVLSQYNNDYILRPVSFYSKRHSTAEFNYEIYNKELMAIVRACEEWCAELSSTEHPIPVLSDNRKLEYFMFNKSLSHCHVQWMELLSRFNFKLTYRLRKAGGKSDALTWRSEARPDPSDKAYQNRTRTLGTTVLLDEQMEKSHACIRLLADIPPELG